MNLSYSEGLDLIERAYTKIEDEKIYMRWIVSGYDRQCSLVEFRQMVMKKVQPKKSAEEVYEKVKKITEMRF